MPPGTKPLFFCAPLLGSNDYLFAFQGSLQFASFRKRLNKIFLQFHEKMSAIFGMIEEVIAESMINLYEAKRRYLSI